MLENPAEQERIHDLTHFIANLEWRVGESDFFQSLVQKLAEAAEVEYAFIGRLFEESDEKEIETIVLVSHGKIEKNVRYELEGTPCETILSKAFCTHKYDVQKLFPADDLLVELDVVGYSGIPLWDHNSNPLGLIAVMTTEAIENVKFIETILQTCAIRASSEMLRLNWEQDLRDSERQFRSIFEDSSIGMTIVDTDGRYLSANRSFCDFVGYSESEVLKLNVENLGGPDDEINASDLHQRFIEGEMDTGAVEKQYVTKNNDVVWGRLNRLPITNADGSIRHVVGQIEDITKQKYSDDLLHKTNQQLEKRVLDRTQELNLAKLDAEASSRIKSEFLANMSHELRTPLNAIHGFAEGLLYEIYGPLRNDKQIEALKYIQSSSIHLQKLINDLLDISAIEAGNLNLHLEKVSLYELIKSASMITQQRTDKKNLQFASKIDPAGPVLFVDELRLKQILVNLITNSIKFTEKGGTITLNWETTKSGGGQIVVSDTGLGMDAAGIDIALARFGRVIPETGLPVEGTGLGIPLSKVLIEAHGGTLKIESELGVGTTVRIELPKECVHRA
jgi:PAS domain S-box-containing protein